MTHAARRRLLVDGVVQGVGFRPFVFKLAEREGLCGFVANGSHGVVIEIQGPVAALDRFAAALTAEAPPLARIAACTAEGVDPVVGEASFTIRASIDSPGVGTLIPPDVAMCADCRGEIADPADRRAGYPFTNCTNCGPRWTIIRRIPYDRPFTSMSGFAMCPDCLHEYEDPRDRRFHAQPNACPVCGPRLRLIGGDGAPVPGDPLEQAAALLAEGRILAVKGLGGFHLAVRADDGEAVARLRRRKGREAKPLAVMVADLGAAEALVELDAAERALLTSPAAPIVLGRRRPDAPVCAEVAGGHRRLGVMLAYTPLHFLLFVARATKSRPALVMTSGNRGDEPICLDDQEALDRLGGIADAWLLHDRPIVRRADDSVVQILQADGHPLPFRRSRGYAPLPVPVAHHSPEVVLAVGPELKNTLCLLKDGRGFLSPHVGDLENPEAFAFFAETSETLQELLECRPSVIAHDLHPGYFSTQWALRRAAAEPGLRLVGVQHHHAHLAAVLAEHGRTGPALGLILDGTGLGSDGTIWGGEILAGDCRGFERVGHLEVVPMPGGEAAVREPWRMAIGHLAAAIGPDPARWPALPVLEGRPVGAILEAMARGVNSPLTSSCGRLFDAVAALTGRWPTARYEAQAAIELMALCIGEDVAGAEPLAPAGMDVGADRCLVVPTSPLIRAAAEAVAAGAGPAEISARFHRTLIDLLTAAMAAAAARTGLDEVVLAGGVMQNELLLGGLLRSLPAAGLRPLRPIELPPGDGAVALGQAAVAAAQIG